MIKSPVEGSTAALIRLETSVVFSNFIRPICLPDKLNTSFKVTSTTISNHKEETLPHTEQLVKLADKNASKVKEIRQYFVAPLSAYQESPPNDYTAEFTDEVSSVPRAQALNNYQQAYPSPSNIAQTLTYYENKKSVAGSSPVNYVQPQSQATSQPLIQPQWTNCNTIGWSKQRDHMQRVQLKIVDMAACENVSIATVNSICAETAYHKQDCTEEEFAGTPVMCVLPDGKQWVLVGISSWRIACAQSGIERPRMYDKMTSNTAWIRDTINST